MPVFIALNSVFIRFSSLCAPHPAVGTLVANRFIKNLLFHDKLTGVHNEKVLLAVAGAALLMAQVGSAMADQLQDIQKRGVIRVAVPHGLPAVLVR